MKRYYILSLFVLLFLPVLAHSQTRIQQGDEVLAVFDVTTFGANVNDFLDDSPAVEAAIAAAKASSVTKNVFVPNGTPGLQVSRPIILDDHFLKFYGDVEAIVSRSNVSSTFGTGPTIYAGPPRKIDTQASLVSGPGVALTLNHSIVGLNGQLLNLSDAPHMSMNRSAATIELFAKSSQAITGPNMLFGSQGVLLSATGIQRAFGVYVGNGGHMQLDFTTETGFHQFVSSPGVWTNGTHHVVLQFGGDVLTLFLDGMPLYSFSEPMLTLKQYAWEEFTVGGGRGDAPFGGQMFACEQMDALDGVRVSSTAKYPSAGFTPPSSKPTLQSDTLMLINFDNLTRDFIVAQTNIVPHWILKPQIDTTLFPFAQLANVEIKNLSIVANSACSGIYANGTVGSKFHNLNVGGATVGFWFRDIYFSDLQDVSAGSEGKIGIAITGQGEVLSANRLNGYHQQFPLVLTAAVGGDFRNIFLTPGAGTVTSLLSKAGDVSITAINVDDESQGTSGLASIIAGDMTALTLIGGQVLSFGSRKPAVIISGNGTGRLSVIGTAFFGEICGPKMIKRYPRIGINNRPCVPEIFSIMNGRPNLVWGSIINPNSLVLTNDPPSVNVVH